MQVTFPEEKLNKVPPIIEKTVERDISVGFLTDQEIIDYVTEYMAETFDMLDTSDVIVACVAKHAKQHAEEESKWSQPTDCDRLDQAFAALEKEGVATGQNKPCCLECGGKEIVERIVNEKRATPWIGLAFYDEQITYRALEGRGMNLAFETYGDKVAKQEVGWRIVRALQNAGLNSDWNGDVDTCIYIPKFSWRRRRKQLNSGK